MTTNNKNMNTLKEEYKEIKMNEEQKKELMKTMERAKMDKRRKANNYKGILAAAAVAAFVVLPNTSAGVAQAMANIPLLGNLVQVVTFRNYDTKKDISFETEKHLIMVYGKNGVGKTTLSRISTFEKKYVFNEDFIYSNVFNAF